MAGLFVNKSGLLLSSFPSIYVPPLRPLDAVLKEHAACATALLPTGRGAIAAHTFYTGKFQEEHFALPARSELLPTHLRKRSARDSPRGTPF